MGRSFFYSGGILVEALKLSHDFVVSCLKRTELAPIEWGIKAREIVSLTLEPMVIGPIFLNFICDTSGRLLHTYKDARRAHLQTETVPIVEGWGNEPSLPLRVHPPSMFRHGAALPVWTKTGTKKFKQMKPRNLVEI